MLRIRRVAIRLGVDFYVAGSTGLPRQTIFDASASQRQWQDVSTVLRLLGEKAVTEYLTNYAHSLGVDDLLLRLLDDCR